MSNEGSDSSDVEQPTDLDTSEGSELPSESPLLMKSREQYQTLYRKFMEWKEANNKESLTEDVFMDYFTDLAEKMKPSTLWSQYSMLKATMFANEKVNINNFHRLRSFLRTKSIGYKSKTSHGFTSREIETFLKDAPDSQYLAEKVSLIFGILGACRSHELVHITVDNIEDDGIMALVTIPKSDSDPERSFTICGEFYQVYKRYALLRPKKTDCRRFFLSYRGGRCVNQVIGLHKFGGMPRQIATFLNLPDPDGYTGHSFRRTSATLLAASGTDYKTLQSHVGWNSKIARDIAEGKRRNQIRLAKRITESVFLKPSTSKSNDNSESRAPVEQVTAVPEQIQSIDDPLFIDCNTTIKEEVSEEIIEPEELPPLVTVPPSAPKLKVVSKLPGKPVVVQPAPQPVVSQPIKIAPKPVIRIQPKILPAPPPPQNIKPKKILPGPPPLQNVSTKRLVVKTISVQRPPVPQPSLNPHHKPTPHRSPEVCLRWGFHHNNMQTSFPSFLNSEEFVDVTLACEGKSVKCHKVILSSCSDYLAALLRENPCQHPIILMKDLKFWEVEALVRFMYKGEVNISHDKLPQLLKAADALQVKGLVNFTPAQSKKPMPVTPQVIRQSPRSVGNPAKSTEMKTQHQAPKPTTNVSNVSAIHSASILRRGIKRPLQVKKQSIVSKYRRPRPKTPPPVAELSPEIKEETLDIPLGDSDIFPETEHYENLIMLNEDSPPEEKPPEPPGDGLMVSPHNSEDISDVQEQMDMLTDFLQQENSFLEKMDAVDDCSGQPPGSEIQYHGEPGELDETDGTFKQRTT
ncbi:uncharacterized protein LOC107039426 isoform X2 [Diachasma alloeum]|uniref:uncharacterized protein LOC107039426 isoform X2 n=1 Tax=Diachasma alloeum TaxID=454923 RepID=UPI0007383725|nr:uncharacterized protein LOC107039426 isoform X2 [Diachasma alloeum]